MMAAEHKPEWNIEKWKQISHVVTDREDERIELLWKQYK